MYIYNYRYIHLQNLLQLSVYVHMSICTSSTLQKTISSHRAKPACSWCWTWLKWPFYMGFCFLILGAVGKIAKKPDCNAKLGEKPTWNPVWEIARASDNICWVYLLGRFRIITVVTSAPTSWDWIMKVWDSNIYQTIKYQSNINQYPTKGYHRCPSLTPIKKTASTSGKIMKPGEKGRHIVNGKPPRIHMVDLGW